VSADLHIRVTSSVRAQLDAEATARGVSISALVRAGLGQFVQDLDQRRLGYVTPRLVVIHLLREPIVAIRIPRRERGGDEPG
jgi:hypothetical protein